MQRSSFFKTGSLAFLGTALLGNNTATASGGQYKKAGKTTRNIIFMVSDGMSAGTLNMTDMYLQRKFGKRGPGSELLKPFVKNYELHTLMLKAAAVNSKS